MTVPTSQVEPAENGRHILVVHCEGVGDDLLSLPFLCAVRRAFPAHRLRLLVGRGRNELFLGLPEYEVIETWQLDRIVLALACTYQIVFDLGTGHARAIDWLPLELTYETYVDFTKPSAIPRELTARRRPDIPAWQHYLALLQRLGVIVELTPETPFAINMLSQQYAALLVELVPGRPRICVAPGASSNPRKRWAPESFASVMASLRRWRADCRFALLGADYDTDLCERIAAQLDFEVDNLAGLTTLGSTAYIVSRSNLLLANDNGLMHLGGILNTPTIGLFGPSDSRTWHPLGEWSRVITSRSGAMEDIAPETLLAAALRLLEERMGIDD